MFKSRETANRALGTTLCNKLIDKGFTSAHFVENKDAAVELLLSLIPSDCSVGIPGTVTARELDLPNKLTARGNKVNQHWGPDFDKSQGAKTFIAEITSDWFVTSTNAVTLDGMMVNIDGTGNRVAGMAWAPGKIVYIFGINKIAHDLEGAINRARDTATPPNALRVGSDTPCTKIGHCVNCNVPGRVCRVLTIQERVPFGRECHAIVIGENLGY